MGETGEPAAGVGRELALGAVRCALQLAAHPPVIPAKAGIHEGLPAALHQPGGLGITKADKSPLPYPEAAPPLGKTQPLAYIFGCPRSCGRMGLWFGYTGRPASIRHRTCMSSGETMRSS